jgi:hypothetical protein
MVFFCVWHGTYSRGLWQAFAIAGAFGFSTAIGIHPIIGYVDFVHLAPAVLGALIFSLGMILIYPEFSKHDRRAVSSRSGVTGSTAHFPHRL